MPHHVAIGALIRPKGVLLVHRRPDLTYYPDCWDFPGGHIEPNESPTEALTRELSEELGILATITGPPQFHVDDRPDDKDGLVLDMWVVTEWTGDVSNLATDEHDDLCWIPVEQLVNVSPSHSSYNVHAEILGKETTGAPAGEGTPPQ